MSRAMFCVGETAGGAAWTRSLETTLHVSGRQLHVSGILSTGGAEDDEIVAPLALAQEILGKPGAVRRVYVSALTKPEDAFARRDPKSLSGAIYDRWYCTPYPQAIALQLTEAIPHSHAEQIRQVSQNEGAVLTRIEGLIFLITLAALFASALAVSAAMATTIFERRAEVGLDEGPGRGQAGRGFGLLRRSRSAGADWRSGGIWRRHGAGTSDWALDLQFGYFHSAGAVAGDPGDRGDCDLCGQRGGDPASREAGSGLCVAR